MSKAEASSTSEHANPLRAVARARADEDWPALLALLRRAFAYMKGRIDPPSSLNRLDAASLEAKAKAGACFLAHDGAAITGCVFCAPKGDALYVGKLAVDPPYQDHGIGRALMAAVEDEAAGCCLAALELEARVELHENLRAFAAMGFTRTGETAHPGHDRPTSITMRKRL